MAEAPLPTQPAAPSVERLFPTLTETQIAAHGRRRAVAGGEILVEVGDAAVPFFLIVSGEVQVLRPVDAIGDGYLFVPR